MSNWVRCPETYDGHHGVSDTNGICPYCQRKVDPKAEMPKRFDMSNLTYYYGMYYDPDFPYNYDPIPADGTLHRA